MQIKYVTPKPYEKSIPPAISFTVEIEHVRYQEAIVNIDGWLESDDGKKLAEIIEVLPENLQSDELWARRSRLDAQFTAKTYRTTLIAPLNKRTLDYIEKRRMEDKKRDVHLTLNLSVKSIGSKAVLFHIYDFDPKNLRLQKPLLVRTPSGRQIDGKIVLSVQDYEYSATQDNRWIISGERKPSFLSVNGQNLIKKGIRIPSTDWIHDYAPKLELGEYFIVEILKGKRQLKKAWEYVEKAEECFRQWDTKGVYANCREVGSLLDTTIGKKFKKDDFVRERWSRTYQRFKTFASLDLHLEDIKQSQKFLAEDVRIGKPDVEHVLIVTKALIKYAEELG